MHERSSKTVLLGYPLPAGGFELEVALIWMLFGALSLVERATKDHPPTDRGECSLLLATQD
jgi:hypothetical protein